MEDFSFPTVEQDHDTSHLHHLPFPHFTTSPLWFLPSVAPLEDSPCTQHRKRSSECDKDSEKGKNVEQCTPDEEEKMDMLWEDFNEELIRAKLVRVTSLESDNEPTNGPLVRHQSPSLILFIKVIRKLLFLRKIGPKKRSPSLSSSSSSSSYVS